MKTIIINDLSKNEFSTMSADNFGRIHFFKDGKIILSKGINRFDLMQEKNGEYHKICLDYLHTLYLSNLRRKNKIDLSAKYNFYGSHIRESWEYCPPKYDLYIYIGGDVQMDYIGELVHNVIDGQTSYMDYYRVTFKNIEMMTYKIEREKCDDYTLKDNEKFGEYYGTKDAPTIDFYDMSKNVFAPRDEKGIIRKWTEKVPQENASYIMTCDYITRQENDAERTRREKIAELMSKATGKTISHYDVENIMNVVNISIKGEQC